MSVFLWSQTAASNGSADPSCPFPEGMAPSAYNDGARGVMSGVAKYRDDISGAIVTGGTSTAYTVASFSAFDTLAHLSGQMIGFAPNATSTNAVGVDVTLNVDGLGAKPIRMQPSVPMPSGTLILGTPYIVVYNNTDGVFYLQNMVNPYVIPLAAGMDFWGTTTPNSSFAFPTGQAISRTTYSALFSLLSTTFGSGDGSTTFNLPDKTGRTSVMKEASATRLTTAGGGVDGGTLGAVGGVQNVTLAAAQIPTITATNASQAISVLSNTSDIVRSAVPFSNGVVLASGSASAPLSGNTTEAQIQSTGNNSISTTYTNGSQTATKTVQPTIVCNYIMRVI